MLELKEVFKKILITFSIFFTFGTAGVIYKNGSIEKFIQLKLDNINNVSYGNVKCVGVTSTTCEILDFKFSEKNSSIFSKKATFEKVEYLENLNSDVNGTFPFIISFEEVEFSEISNLYNNKKLNNLYKNANFFKDSDKYINIEIVGEITRNGSNEDLKLNHLLISNNLADLNISVNMRVENKKLALLQKISIDIKDKQFIHRIYDSKYADKNISFPEFKKIMVLGLDSSKKSKIEKDLNIALETFILDDEKNILHLSVETLSKEYVDVYQLFITYNMLLMFQGLESLEKTLYKTLDIKIEAK